MVPHVLAVDDDPTIRQLVVDYLGQNELRVTAVPDGKSMRDVLAEQVVDLVVLDLRLKSEDGMALARTLRDDSAIPIIMLTGRAEEADRVMGLELGADDYLTKPFSPRELVARVRAVLRRAEPTDQPSDVIRAGDVALDVARMRAEVDGRTVELTPTEFQLLATLAARPGRIFTRSQLLDALHGVAFESYERAIDTHVKNLRRKLEADPRQPRHILTVYGVGYRFADDRA